MVCSQSVCENLPNPPQKRAGKTKNKEHLISDGDVGALPAVLSCSLHTVLTDGFVVDGNSLRQFAVFQNHLRRQRLSKNKEDRRDRSSTHVSDDSIRSKCGPLAQMWQTDRC